MPESPIGGATLFHNGDNISNPNTVESVITQDNPPELPDLCRQIHERLEIFLNAEPKNERIRAVQKQSRESLGVIEGALRSYS